MLAQLDNITGVAGAQVDVTGRRFVLATTRKCNPEYVVGRALEILGPGCSLQQEMASSDEGEEGIWLDSGNIRSLSLLEARILAFRWGAAASKAAGLPDDLSGRLPQLLESELATEFNRVHTSGGAADPGWHRRAFPAAFDRVIAAMRQIVPAQANAVLKSLLGSLNE